MFLRAFVAKSTAVSWVNISPVAATLLHSAASAVTESAPSIAAATKPNFQDCIVPSKIVISVKPPTSAKPEPKMAL
jgi:hypothetical protein